MLRILKFLWIGTCTKYWDKRTLEGWRPKKWLRIIVSHHKQRYNTVGDYYFTFWGTLVIVVSDTGDWRYNFLIAYHEETEIPLLWDAGITFGVVDEFDLEYDKKRMPGDTSEPGDMLNCPYHGPHRFADGKEREMAKKLSVDWDEYVLVQDKLMKERTR